MEGDKSPFSEQVIRTGKSISYWQYNTYDDSMGLDRSGTPYAIGRVMRFRIAVESVGDQTRISISGELVGEGVPEIEQVSGVSHGGLEIDLSELRFADDDGVELLRRLIDNGAIMTGASPLIRNLLAI